MSAIAPLWILIAALFLAAVVAVIVSIARARGGEAVVRITFVIAVIWASVCIVGAGFTAIATIHDGSGTHITFPVQTFWPQLPSGTILEGMTAELESGGFTEVTGTVSGLSLGTRILWAASQALWWLIPGTIAALLALACRGLLHGRAFTPIVSRMAMITAGVVAVGGIVAQMLGDTAGSMASTQVLQWASAQYEEVAGIEDGIQAWWPDPALFIELPFWPIAAGLAFATLAAVLRYGSELQRDTEGLV